MVLLSKLGDLQKKRSSPKFKGFFRPKSEIQGFFSGRILVISKQKKKVFTEIRRVFPAEIRNSKVCFRPKSETQGIFRPNTGDLQQKKTSPPKFKGFFQPKSEIQGFVSGRNQKLKGFFRPNAGDLQQKKNVFTEIQRVFPAEIRNSKGFSGLNQVISKK